MSDAVNGLVGRYFEAWNDFDGASRAATLEEIFTPEADIIDPDWTAEGREAIVTAISAAREKLGDLPLDLTTVVGAHHDTVLYTWHLGGADAPVATGTGVLVLEKGRIATAYNFFG